MPKAKLKIEKTEFKKLQVAAAFSDLTLLKPEETKVVGKTVFVGVSYRSANQLFEAGVLMGSVDGTELDATEEAANTKVKKK